MIDPRPKILIGIPQPESTHHWFQESVWNMMCVSFSDFILQRYHAVGSVIAYNRNTLVKVAKEMGADYLLQIDADSVFPPNALKTLHDHNLPIVGATTTKRDGKTFRPMCDPLKREKVTRENSLIPVRLIGMNFMLIKMEVFDKLKAPYYADPPRWMAAQHFDLPSGKTEIEEYPELVMEDEYFCTMVRAAGYEIICDMALSMQMGHIGSTIYYIKPESQAPKLLEI